MTEPASAQHRLLSVDDEPAIITNLADQSSPEERRQTLASVQAQTLRLSRLASDLQKLAEQGTRSLERRPVNIADLLQEAVEVMGEQSETEGRPVSLTLPQAPWPIPAVEGDPDLLFLAVHNLLANALKFTQPGDTVEVRAFEDGMAVVTDWVGEFPGREDAAEAVADILPQILASVTFTDQESGYHSLIPGQPRL